MCSNEDEYWVGGTLEISVFLAGMLSFPFCSLANSSHTTTSLTVAGTRGIKRKLAMCISALIFSLFFL